MQKFVSGISDNHKVTIMILRASSEKLSPQQVLEFNPLDTDVFANLM